MLEQVESWPVDTVAVGVTDADATLATHGPVDRPFRLASITKPLTALTVLLAADRGVLHLDEPTGTQGATVRHLLGHASGLPPSEGGPTSEPGRRRVYSNLGYERLADLVEQRVDGAFADELRFELLDPLAMQATTLEGSAAAGAVGSVDDLLRLGRELLAPDVLPAEVVHAATTVAFPGLDGVLPGFGRQTPNDWGLGFELRDHKSPHWTGGRNDPATFGHFGQSGSFLWIDPAAGLACAFLCDRDFGPWAAQRWPAFSDAVLEEFT